MASQGFSFPPPPPPPPPTQQPPQQTFGNANAYPSQNAYSNNYGGHRGGGSTGGGYRGRGRGGMNRGRGGGNYNSYGHNNNNQGIYGGGYTAPSPLNYQNGYQQPYTPAAPGYPQTHASPSAYPHTTYGGSYGTASGTATVPVQSYTQPAAYGAPVSYPAVQPSPTPVTPWGYNNSAYPGSTTATPYATGTYQNPTHRGGGHHRGGQKRPFSSAFEKPNIPRVAAAPAVPSFGVPLPAKPPQPVNTPRKEPKKKKRKSNMLGLTPRTEEHESSEEEDVDEEARYQSQNQGGPIQVTFRGRTSTLSTAADIQAWIEERKKKFPTQARIEEKKKAQEEAKKKREREREEARRKQLELKQQREQAKAAPKDVAPMDAVAKAKAKAEKLRKKLLKEERRLQKAEADAERARLVAEVSQQPSTAEAQSTQSTTDQPAAEKVIAEKDTGEVPTQTNVAEKEEPSVAPIIPVPATDIGDDLSDISDSSSEDDSEDDDDDDGAPEEMSSRREGPERVPPPPRQKSTRACRDFQRKGKCPRGAQCRFSHEPRTKTGVRQPPPPPAKRGLYQMLVAQETQSRDRQVMQAISWLGSQGLLEEADPDKRTD